MDTVKSGSVKDIVRYTSGTDARETVVDAKSGAKIRINIDDVDEGGIGRSFEPFYIEYGDNLYTPETRREAEMILSNIRKGEKYPDMPSEPKPRKSHSKSKRTTVHHDVTVRVLRG